MVEIMYNLNTENIENGICKSWRDQNFKKENIAERSLRTHNHIKQ